MIDFLNDQGIQIQNLRPKDMHITLAFNTNEEAMKYIKELIENNEIRIGEEIKIHIRAYGEYRNQNGMLLNQGLKVELSDPKLEKYCNHGVPHLTLSFNPEKDLNGKQLSRPIDTYKCVFDKELDYTINGRLGSFTEKGVKFEELINEREIRLFHFEHHHSPFNEK